MWTEKPISLRSRVTSFPDVDTSSAISGFCLIYLFLNSSQHSSLLANSYCSFIFPSSFNSVTYMERLCTSKPIMIPTTSIVVSESLESEITRQTSIHPCSRVLCRAKGSQSEERPRGSSQIPAASPALTLAPSCKRGQKYFYHQIISV